MTRPTAHFLFASCWIGATACLGLAGCAPPATPRISLATWNEGGHFVDRAAAEPTIVGRLGEPAIRSALGLEGFLEHLDVLYARIFTD